MSVPAEEQSSDPSLTKTSEDVWHRVHPISPMVRGWLAILAVLFVFGRDRVEGIFTGDVQDIPSEAIWWIVGAGSATVLIIALIFYLSWRFTRYQVTAEHVKVNSGVLFRQQRQARLDRVQAIDLGQPLLARIFGLAELKFEVADAGESAVKLSFLKLQDARRLRATILSRASGDESPESPDQPEEAERPILKLTAGRVLGATLLSGATVFLILLAAIAVTLSVVFEQPLVITGLLPVLIGIAASYWTMFSNSFNFRVSVLEDGIRLRYGLLDTRTQTIPPGRVQAVGVMQSPLWRLTGWYKVSLNVAGYGGAAGGESGGRSTLLPVGTRQEVMELLALVLPDPGTEDPMGLFHAGLEGKNDDGGFTTSPRRVRWISPLTWRRNGFVVTRTALVARSGAFWRYLAVVPHERTQSMALERGPLSRRFHAMDLVLHTTPGPVALRVRQMDNRTAVELFDLQSARAAEARKHSIGDRWRERPASRDDAARSEEDPHD
ncbi:PH domain-containing protein [Arthrobacter roseus]